MYTNFIEEQYMSIFAMALQYTNCERFSQHIVAVAHQVIADWFTRCRLVYRKGFAKLIAKALKSSMFTSDEQTADKGLSCSQTLHKEMTNVCLDMMARYSFSSHFGQYNRSSLTDSMLSQGTSQTWLMENMVVTITTSNPESRLCNCAHCVQVRNTCQKKKSKGEEEEMTSMSTYQSINTVDMEEIKTIELKDTKEDEIENPVNKNKDTVLKETSTSANEIDIVAGTLEETESPCDEEGCEPTALVAKLTQQLVEQDNAFSPSERLMFSRQASRVPMSENNEVDNGGDEEEDDESSESEDEYMSKANHDIDQESPVFVLEEFDDIDNFVEQHHKSSNGSHVDQDKLPVLSKKASDPLTMKQQVLENQCQAECGGWAEIVIQRPTGKTSWVMRMEKKENIADVTLSELSLLTRSMEATKIYDRIGI